MRYLNAMPLPKTFTWPHRDGGERSVQPSHSAVIGYGKWLAESPYWPGVFELCHDLLEKAAGLPDDAWAARYGQADALADDLNQLRQAHPMPAREVGKGSLAHRLRPLIWQRDQEQLPLP